MQSTLRRTTSFELKIRKATKEAIMELNATGVNCVCRKGLLMAAGNVCEKESVIGFRKVDLVAPFVSPSGKAHRRFQPVSGVKFIIS